MNAMLLGKSTLPVATTRSSLGLSQHWDINTLGLIIRAAEHSVASTLPPFDQHKGLPNGVTRPWTFLKASQIHTWRSGFRATG